MAIHIHCCKECVSPKRHINCHSTCKEYLDEKKQLEKDKEIIRKNKESQNFRISLYDYDRICYADYKEARQRNRKRKN